MAMIKYTSFGPLDGEGCPVVEPVKTTRMASYHTEYVPAIAAFIKALQPEAGHIYVLSHALGGSEVWGYNNNGDLFPAKPSWGIAHPGRDWGYETFKYFADVFRQHRNQKSQGHPSYGKIVCSAWNPRMWRVETIAQIKRGQPDIEDIISEIDAGKPVAVSMGCRIPFDECSLCGNLAKTSKNHCEHIRTMNKQIMPNGVVIGMINHYPTFFDQSFVRKGADPSAWAYRKVGEGPAIIDQGNVKIAGDDGVDAALYGAFRKVAEHDHKRAADKKQSAMYKEVPGVAVSQVQAEHGQTIREFMKKVQPRLRGREEPMPRSLQAKISSDHTMSQIWSTLHFAGIDLHPEEFQYMALKQAGLDELADTLANDRIVFDPLEDEEAVKASSSYDLTVSTDHIDPPLFETLVREAVMEKRSYWRPYLLMRTADLCKTASQHLPAVEASGQPVRPLSSPTIVHGGGQHIDPYGTSTEDQLAHILSPPPEESLLEDTPTFAPVLLVLSGAYALARKRLAQLAPETLIRFLGADPKSSRLAQLSAEGLDAAKTRKALDGDLTDIAALPVGALLAADGFRDLGEAGGPHMRGEIYWESPHIKTADVKRFLGFSFLGVPGAYMGAGHVDARQQVGEDISKVDMFLQANPTTTGLAGAAGATVGSQLIENQVKRPSSGGSPSMEFNMRRGGTGNITRGQAEGVWGTAKKWIGGLSKRADLLEAMAFTPVLYDVDPAVADRILVDAVEESVGP